jgi:5'-3' exoribonuclease 2
MNQQRSRRFRAAKDAEIQRLEDEKLAQLSEQTGQDVPIEKPKSHFDSNCITPGIMPLIHYRHHQGLIQFVGSPFMHKLALSLRYYIAERYQSTPGWKNVSPFTCMCILKNLTNHPQSSK